jgi:hypothetical protein
MKNTARPMHYVATLDEAKALVKERDRYAEPAEDPVAQWTTSVATGRNLSQIAGAEPEAHPNHQRRQHGCRSSGPQLRRSSRRRRARLAARDQIDGYRAIADRGSWNRISPSGQTDRSSRPSRGR